MTMQSPTPKDSKNALPATRANGAATDAQRPAAVLAVDPAMLTDEQLAALAAAVPNEIAARKAKREGDFFALVEEQARALNIPAPRLAAALRAKSEGGPGPAKPRDRRSDVKPVYRDPVSGDTWAGRGKPAAWVEFGNETNPKGERLPLRKFWIVEQDKK